MSTIREASERQAKLLGYLTNPTLPLLDEAIFTRTTHEIASRAMILNACCRVSYGVPAAQARAWLDKNALLHKASPEETALLNGGICDPVFKLRPEAMWALAWVLMKTDNFPYHLGMPNDAVGLFPNVKTNDSTEPWISQSIIRDSATVLKALDFYYCIHWALGVGMLREALIYSSLAVSDPSQT